MSAVLLSHFTCVFRSNQVARGMLKNLYRELALTFVFSCAIDCTVVTSAPHGLPTTSSLAWVQRPPPLKKPNLFRSEGVSLQRISRSKGSLSCFENEPWLVVIIMGVSYQIPPTIFRLSQSFPKSSFFNLVVKSPSSFKKRKLKHNLIRNSPTKSQKIYSKLLKII